MKKIAGWKKDVLIIIFLSAFLFILGNGSLGLTNPDEVFYADSAKEMALHNSWATPYIFGQPQFEKPVFIYWLLRLSFLAFGLNSFAARISPGIFAVFGTALVYILGFLGFSDRKKAFFSALILATGALYLGLARTVFTDMVFTVFILAGLAAFYWAYSRGRRAGGIALFFIFSALAVLTKGPLGLFIPGLIVLVFLSLRKDIKFIICRPAFYGLIIFSAIALPWYAFMIKHYGNDFIREFWVNDHIRRIFHAEHCSNDRWYFYPLTMLGGMYPWVIYVFAGICLLVKKVKDRVSGFHLFLACWLGTVFLFFQPAHSKLASYIMPLFPALALTAGDFFTDNNIGKITRAGKTAAFASGLFLLAVPVAVRIAGVKFPYYFAYGWSVPAIAVMSWVFVFIFILMTALGRPVFAFFVQAGLIPALLVLLPLINVEPYVSSRSAAQFLLKQPVGEGAVLCSGPFIRGIRFYGGYNAAVFGQGGDNFFSPHPVPFVNSPAKLRDFLDKQPVTYCVLTKAAGEALKQEAGAGYKAALLGVCGNEYILKVEKE